MAAKVDDDFGEVFEGSTASCRLFDGDGGFTKASIGAGGTVPRFGLICVEPSVFPIAVADEIEISNPHVRARYPVIYVLDTLEHTKHQCFKIFTQSDLKIVRKFFVTVRKRLERSRGVPTHNFHLFLKECAFLTTYDRNIEEWLAAEMGFKWRPIEQPPKEYSPAEIEAWKAHLEEVKK